MTKIGIERIRVRKFRIPIKLLLSFMMMKKKKKKKSTEKRDIKKEF
jgi:hypothetical protein